MIYFEKRRESGQALIEFMIMFPVILTFVWYLLKVNTAITVSVIGQKHVRSQMFLKLLNHSDGPVDTEYTNNPRDRSVFFMGVAGKPIVDAATQPAPVIELGVGLKPRELPGARNDPGEVSTSQRRQNVRVRTVMGICTSRKPQSNGTLGDFCGEVSL